MKMTYLAFPVDVEKINKIVADARLKDTKCRNIQEFIEETYGITYATYNTIRNTGEVKFHTRAKLRRNNFPIDKVVIE